MVFLSFNGKCYKTEKEMEQANVKFIKIFKTPITDDNIIKKTVVLTTAAEEMACWEYDGYDDDIFDLATQLYNHFDGDREKAEKFYSGYPDKEWFYSPGPVEAIWWLKR